MNKDELLKIYSACLPYKLEVWYAPLSSVHTLKRIEVRNDDDHLIEISNNITIKESISSEDIKPIFWDLSYLTKEIEHEGERFVPIKKIYEINGWEWNDDEANEIDEIGICSDLDVLTYATAQLLLSWHFNIFSLPESEYINKATLTNK